MTADLVRIAIRVPTLDSEIARARMLDLAPPGFEEIAHTEEIELAAYVDAAAADRIRAVFPNATETAVDPGWEDAWRAFHRPVVAGGIWLGPPWEETPPGMPAVVIDPGRAFGTGAHATTRLCVELLSRLEPGSLLDVGCGSGVLAIAAARLGYGPVTAVDIDAVALAVARKNAALNGVSLELHQADATMEPLRSADVVVANITLDAVERVLARADARCAVTSGYLDHEQPHAEGWEPVDRAELDGWAADLLRRVTI